MYTPQNTVSLEYITANIFYEFVLLESMIILSWVFNLTFLNLSYFQVYCTTYTNVNMNLTFKYNLKHVIPVN